MRRVYDASVWWSRCADLTSARALVGEPEKPGKQPRTVGERWRLWCEKVHQAEPVLMPEDRDERLDEQVGRYLFQGWWLFEPGLIYESVAELGLDLQEVCGGRFVVLTERA